MSDPHDPQEPGSAGTGTPEGASPAAAGAASAASRRWARPNDVRQTGPDRRARGFYRFADGSDRNPAGIPLGDTEDAVIAAVRLAYRVADAQVARSARLAKRLRTAGERVAGPEGERDAVDAAEGLVFRSIMTGLSWLEGVAAERDSPIKRMLAAEYRMLGSLLGVRAPDAPTPAGTAAAASGAGVAGVPPPRRPLDVVHAGEARRAVRVVAFDLSGVKNLATNVAFYRCDGSGAALPATLLVEGRSRARLTIATPADVAAGAWRAAIVGADGLQLGTIDIEV